MHSRSARAAVLVSFLSGAAAGDGLDSLSWMSGAWHGSQNGVEMEEVWTAPRGGSMLGVHRDVAAGKTTGFEFLRIAVGSDGVTYWGSPEGRPATPFRMVKSEARRVVFENPTHDFPTRILYWLSEDGALHARIEGTLKGKPASE